MRWRRTRWALEWLSLVVLVLTPFLWTLTLMAGFHCRRGLWTVSIDDGAVTVWKARLRATGYSMVDSAGFFEVKNRSLAGCVPMLAMGQGPFQWIARVPVWAGLVLGGGASLVLWKLNRPERRRFAGRCAACGYDVRGIAPHGVCPECGKAVAETLPA